MPIKHHKIFLDSIMNGKEVQFDASQTQVQIPANSAAFLLRNPGQVLQIDNELNETYLCTIVRIKYDISNV